MTFYSNIAYPFLSNLDAELTHDMTLNWLERAQNAAWGKALLRQIAGDIPEEPTMIAGLRFPNVLGVAAGFDKDVRVTPGLIQLGFGHIEVGTLTPKPQKGNRKPRVFRLPQDGGLINRMGFPNGGVKNALPRLKALSNRTNKAIIGVSLGKQKETPLESAADDYITVMQAVYPYADYLAVNISSPNTPGLRELQGTGYLGNLLGQLQAENGRLARQKGGTSRPLFLKIAPDITDDQLDDILFAATANKVDAIIATNTTLSRDGLVSRKRIEQGGLSGTPLKSNSTRLIKLIRTYTEGKMPVIGVGGVRTAEDVAEKLRAGAVAVQVYTGLVYEGPAIAGRILRQRASDHEWLQARDRF